MKKLLIILLSFSVTTLFGQETSNYLDKLNTHRTEMDKEFGDTSTSILPNELVLKFKHLNYFKPNQKFNILADFKKNIGEIFLMTTSSGKTKTFRQYGVLSFKIDRKLYKLPIYQNIKLMQNEEYKDYIFIPFTDLTNGSNTYGGGRYIEAEIPTGKTYQIDFNYAFNPYCHYTTGYNCPIPPKENFINLRIEAGEKIFKSDAH
tara:strand:- start:5457 stop:6068 length:612 start_codon:yes stop_codon:yes gene_type:complete